MPESPHPKLRPPPADCVSSGDAPIDDAAVPDWAELTSITNFSFLRGASHAEELMKAAARLGHRAVGVADHNTLAGIVRAHTAARDAGVRLVVGARLDLACGTRIVVWPQSRSGYAALCRLLTLGKSRVEKGEFLLHTHEFLADASDLQVVVLPESLHDDSSRFVAQHDSIDSLRAGLSHRLSLAISLHHEPDNLRSIARHLEWSRAFDLPLLAHNDVHYHVPERRPLQDVLTCIRHGCSIEEAGHRLFANAERHLKPPEAMHRLFADLPQAIRRSLDVADACRFSLDELRYEYPHELVPEGLSPIEHLRRLTEAGAADRFPDGVPDRVRGQIEHELRLIDQLHFAYYFLTVHDLVVFARSRGILCQGRGSAANSAVCYCLGVTAVDPSRIDLLFERFISAARNEPPDIDVDFEHERREEVIQYIYQKYGRHRAGMTAEVITYRGRSAVREVGRALGLGLDQVDQMAKRLDWWHRGVLTDAQLVEAGLDPTDANVQRIIALSSEILGFPRHLGQHVGGMVMTQSPLCELVPIENARMADRTIIEWDKDDIDAMGMVKVDCLALGMLTAISRAFGMIGGWENAKAHERGMMSDERCHDEDDKTNTNHVELKRRDATLTAERSHIAHRSSLIAHRPSLNIPPDDARVYDMMCRADTIGVFQIESRAQMSMLPRLRPRSFYDLVIEVAIVRPGPIQGDMVHPYLRRRNGEESVDYPSDALRSVLEKTLGVPLFQEQAMKVAMVAAGFSAEEADQLRRAMAAWRKTDKLSAFYDRIIQGMIARGYAPEFAERTFNQIKGFGEYGFPESHAASFAQLVYVSAWIKRHHPAAFCAALINSQPMGFYAPAQLVRDARDHGVPVRPADVNHSNHDCTLEDDHAMDHDTQSKAPNSATLHADTDLDPTLDDPSTYGVGGPAMRLGLRMIKGLQETWSRQIEAARARVGRFSSVEHFQRATNLPRPAIERLAEADAFASLALSRRESLWDGLGLESAPSPLIDPTSQVRKNNDAPNDPIATQPTPADYLPTMSLGQEVLSDYATTGLSLKRHPMALVRPDLARLGIRRAREATSLGHGSRVSVCGLVLIRQRPGTASGIVFITLEDETGIVNLIVRPKLYERFRSAARHSAVLQCDGTLERRGDIVHVMARRLIDRSQVLAGLDISSRDFH